MQRFKALTSSTREGLGGEDRNTAFLMGSFHRLMLFDHDRRVIGLTKGSFCVAVKVGPGQIHSRPH